jgi:hypothetical protein
MMMTDGAVETDDGIGITTGIMTETMIVTGTIGGGEVVTATIATTGDGETIAIATTDIIGIVGTIAGNDQRIQLVKNQATRFNRVAFLFCGVVIQPGIFIFHIPYHILHIT